MTHALFLVMMAILAGIVVWLEWPSLVNARMKAVFLAILVFSYSMAVVITFHPGMPGPLQLWEHMVGPYVSSWLPS